MTVTIIPVCIDFAHSVLKTFARDNASGNNIVIDFSCEFNFKIMIISYGRKAGRGKND